MKRLVLGAALAAASLAVMPLQATAQNYELLTKYAAIREGMTLAEVESLMGKPFDGQCGGDTSWPASIEPPDCRRD